MGAGDGSAVVSARSRWAIGGASIGAYVARRLLVLAVLLVAVSFAVFCLLYLAPGNPIDMLLGQRPRTPATVSALTREYNLDKPFFEQYWLWAWRAMHLDFGTSIQTSLPVATEIKARLPTSLFLGCYAFGLATITGVGLGVQAAVRRRTLVDRFVVGAAVVGLSTPVFVSGVGLLYVFAIQLHWLPAFGKGNGFFDELWHLTLPAIALAVPSTAYILKHARAAMLGVLEQDYIVFARARGLSPWRILFSYSLRNALIPVVTMCGLVLSSLIVGAVLTEMTFSVQGIGHLLVQSALAKDIAVIQCVSLLVAVSVMATNLLADVLYLFVDPRIRIGRR
ncbi:MAG: ABC transporter permease [Mesorhizobium sp.]|nr:MAG: ABC transporter permease [Mesorhizobium sp.]TIP91879.1 MAG: ABC transporter permease [Mesorhizobium sp.]